MCLRYALPPICADLAEEVDRYTTNTLPADIEKMKQMVKARVHHDKRFSGFFSTYNNNTHRQGGKSSSILSGITSYFRPTSAAAEDKTAVPSLVSTPISVIEPSPDEPRLLPMLFPQS